MTDFRSSVQLLNLSEMVKVFDKLSSEKNKSQINTKIVSRIRSCWKSCVYDTLNIHSLVVDAQGKTLHVIADHKIFAHDLEKHRVKVLANVAHHTGFQFNFLKVRIDSKFKYEQILQKNKEINTTIKLGVSKTRHPNYEVLEEMIQRLGKKE